MPKTIAPYGTWKTPIELEQLFQRPSVPMYPQSHQGHIYWIEARAAEAGRLVLVRCEEDGRAVTLTPQGFNIRTRVHEYGGRCHCLVDDHVYFSNFADQRLYVQALEPSAVPRPLTPPSNADGSVGNYADLTATSDGKLLVFVYEQAYAERENVNSIACISLAEGGRDVGLREPTILAAGEDFYANPVICADARTLAWVQWRHPHMPWDETELAVATTEWDEAERVSLGDVAVVAGGAGCSVCQLQYGHDGTLFFAMDRGDTEDPADSFWNLYTYGDETVRRLTSDLAEYGAPHWIFGDTRHTEIDPHRLLAVRTRMGDDELVYVDRLDGRVAPVESDYVGFAQVHAVKSPSDGVHSTEALVIAASATAPAALVRLNIESGDFETVKSHSSILNSDDVSRGQPLHYPTRDGSGAHAYFYRPASSSFAAPSHAKPPLVVFVHGGPTSRTDRTFAEVKQYWTTMGYAVLDVNYRGSSGYGRHYRQALLEGWGEIDVADIADGVQYLIAHGEVDPAQICIRGGSAGGYAVLCALTRFPDLFGAGASYYGIGNLVTLALTTHKFEARYLDGLIGESYDKDRSCEPDSAYYLRSPINFMDRLRSPTILFQGTDDQVVPPRLSRDVVETLELRGVVHEYHEYPGEGHGFRRMDTRVDALQRETAFYARVLGFSC